MCFFRLGLRIQSVGTDSSRGTKGMKNQNSGHLIFVENEILLWCFNVVSYMLNIAAKILFHHHPHPNSKTVEIGHTFLTLTASVFGSKI